MICKYCNQHFDYAGTGRIPDYCSGRCRQAMYRLAKNGFVRHRVSTSIKLINELSLRNSAGTGDYRQTDLTLL